MELSYIWFWAGILFLIVEILTFTFYWLSLALASFLLACMVYSNWDSSFTIMQGLIFVFLSAIFAILFTKYLRPKTKAKSVWLDSYIWSVHKLEKIWDDWKIKIDWVDYLVDDDSIVIDFWVGKKVKLLEHNSGTFKVELV
jgi:predicted membrane protein